MSRSPNSPRNTAGLNPHIPDEEYRANTLFGDAIWTEYAALRSRGRNKNQLARPSPEVIARVGKAWLHLKYTAREIATAVTDARNGNWGIPFEHLSSNNTVQKIRAILDDASRLRKSMAPQGVPQEDASMVPLEWAQAVDYVLGLVRYATGSTNCLTPEGLAVLGSYIGNPDPIVACLYSHYNPAVMLIHGQDALQRLLDRPTLARHLADDLRIDLRPLYAFKPPD